MLLGIEDLIEDVEPSHSTRLLDRRIDADRVSRKSLDRDEWSTSDR